MIRFVKRSCFLEDVDVLKLLFHPRNCLTYRAVHGTYHQSELILLSTSFSVQSVCYCVAIKYYRSCSPYCREAQSTINFAHKILMCVEYNTSKLLNDINKLCSPLRFLRTHFKINKNDYSMQHLTYRLT